MAEQSRSSYYRTSSSFPAHGVLKDFHPTSFRSRKTKSQWGQHSFFEDQSCSDALNLDRHTAKSHVHFKDEIRSPRHALAPNIWPPPGLTYHSKLTGEEVERLIRKGACVFEGFLSQAPHGTAGHVRYNASPSTGGGNRYVQPDCTSPESLGNMAIARIDSIECCSPWEFLAQPVMASPFGAQPGTITIDHWVSMAGHPVVVDDMEEGLVNAREMEFFDVLSRLEQLQRGEITGDPMEREYSLYALLISDPTKRPSYENNMEQEILALSNCLNHPFWIDFSLTANQANIVTRYESQDPEKALFFFQQLLLGVELYLRLQADLGGDTRTMEILSFLPPRVAWTVAMAQIWLSTVIVERQVEEELVSAVALPFRVSIQDILRQKKRLVSLAHALKWPYSHQVENALNYIGNNNLMSAHTTHPSLMSFLSGLILPGPTTSHLLIESLISLGPDNGSSILLPLVSTSPTISGFQYGGKTYWHCTSIMGKVLAAFSSCSSDSDRAGLVAGWVGPCAVSEDLDENQAVRVVTDTEVVPGRGMKKRKVKSMLLRSEALGPRDEIYPVDEYALVVLPPPDLSSSRSKNTAIQVTKIGFRPAPNPRAAAQDNSSSSNQYEAAIFFRIGSLTYPIRLRHNISFISSPPCTSGPHVLFHDYTYLPIHISSLVRLKRWGPFDSSSSPSPSPSSSPSSSSSSCTSSSFISSSSPSSPPFSSFSSFSSSSRPRSSYSSLEQDKKPPSSATASFSSTSESSARTGPAEEDYLSDAVILIQISGRRACATSAEGNEGEVLARAWCAFYGFSAVVAAEREQEGGGGLGGTCMACAIRQAYACCVNVVIYRGG